MLMKMDVIVGMSQQMQYVSVSVLHPPKKWKRAILKLSFWTWGPGVKDES